MSWLLGWPICFISFVWQAELLYYYYTILYCYHYYYCVIIHAYYYYMHIITIWNNVTPDVCLLMKPLLLQVNSCSFLDQLLFLSFCKQFLFSILKICYSCLGALQFIRRKTAIFRIFTGNLFLALLSIFLLFKIAVHFLF